MLCANQGKDAAWHSIKLNAQTIVWLNRHEALHD